VWVQTETAPRRIAYQPGLDGLRGVAVAAVVFFHGNVRIAHTWGRGGFLGVDIFFVLSGFLITSLLVAEYGSTGRIALRTFWSRRVRRLFPGVVVTLALVAVYAALSPAVQRIGLRSDAVFSLLYVQNWHAVWSHDATATSPLNHMWSLSIEEQWYLVWPIALWAALRIKHVRRRGVIAIVAVLAAASALWTYILYSPIDAGRAYFGTDTRAQELLVGAAFALLLLNRPDEHRRVTRRGLEVIAWCSAAFVGFELLRARTTDAFLYHGGFLLVALATGIVITAVTSSGGPLRRALSAKPLVGLGLISYGVYLYHRPIFALMTSGRVGFTGLWLFVVHVAAALGFAWLSYRYIERPIRNGTLQLSRPRLLASAATVTAGSLLLLVILGEPAGVSLHRLPPETLAALDQRRLATPPQTTRVLVVGEQPAFALQLRLKDTYDGGGISGLAFGLLGCGIGAGNILLGSSQIPQGRGCDTWPGTFHDIIDAYRPDVTVLMVGDQEIFDRAVGSRALRVGTPAWEAMFRSQLDIALETLTARGGQVLVATSPCALAPTTIAAFAPVERNARRREDVNSALGRYAALRHLRLADLATLLCPDGQPLRVQDGRIVSTSRTGLTDAGATFVWKWLATQVRPRSTTTPGGP
jgi:peptidoglycan/LPS O-acetylase OafA/YrhL